MARAQAPGDVFYELPSPQGTARPYPPSTPTLPVYEPPAAPFGTRGEWVVSGSTSLGGSWQKFDASSARFESAVFSPGLDWFVARDVSVGVGGTVSWSDNEGYGADGSLVDSKYTAVRVGPRVGYALHLGRRVTLWPTGTLGLEWYRESQSLVSGSSLSTGGSPLGYPTTREFGPWVGVDLPLLYHPMPHFFFGVDVDVFHDFANVQGGTEVGGQETHVGFGFLLGGWFGGRAPPAEIEPAVATRLPRFGDAGDAVFSNELTLGGSWTGYAGSAARSYGGSLDLGLDYFIAEHVSIGASASGSLSSSRSTDASTGSTLTTSSNGWGISGRLGIDVPLGRHASLWPRAALGFSKYTVVEDETSKLVNAETITNVSLYAPVLVHPATHFFFGLGPSVTRNLSRAIAASSSGSAPSVQNPSTSVGAGAIVGGWY